MCVAAGQAPSLPEWLDQVRVHQLEVRLVAVDRDQPLVGEKNGDALARHCGALESRGDAPDAPTADDGEDRGRPAARRTSELRSDALGGAAIEIVPGPRPPLPGPLSLPSLGTPSARP